MHLERLSPAEFEAIAQTSKRDFFEKRGYKWEGVEPILTLDKTYRKVFDSLDDVHHVVPTSNFGSNNGVNRITIPIAEHRKLHAYHRNRRPDQQIIHDIDLSIQAIQNRIARRITCMVEDALNEGKFYKEGVLK